MIDRNIRTLYRNFLKEEKTFFKRDNRVFVRYSDGIELGWSELNFGYSILNKYLQDRQ